MYIKNTVPIGAADGKLDKIEQAGVSETSPMRGAPKTER